MKTLAIIAALLCLTGCDPVGPVPAYECRCVDCQCTDCGCASIADCSDRDCCGETPTPTSPFDTHCRSCEQCSGTTAEGFPKGLCEEGFRLLKESMKPAATAHQ